MHDVVGLSDAALPEWEGLVKAKSFGSEEIQEMLCARSLATSRLKLSQRSRLSSSELRKAAEDRPRTVAQIT